MNRTVFSSLAGVGFGFCALVSVPASAQTAPPLGTTLSFGVLSGQAVTSTGPSVVSGDVGVSPGSAVVGFPPGIVSGGTIHAADAVAAQAQIDLVTAYDNLAGQTCTSALPADPGGLTLTPGVYCAATAVGLTGTLTLNAQGNPAAVFIFLIGSTLTTATNSSVIMTNTGQACNVFWQVGSSATLGTNTTFAGNILALTSITLTTGADMVGRVLARNGAVSLDTNDVDSSTCAAAVPTLPQWATIALTVLLALAGFAALRKTQPARV